MGKTRFIEADIRDRNIITIPKKVMKALGAEVGDTLVFTPKEDHFIVGILKRNVLEMNIKFNIKDLEKFLDQLTKSNSD